jgi:hypothetical protein
MMLNHLKILLPLTMTLSGMSGSLPGTSQIPEELMRTLEAD